MKKIILTVGIPGSGKSTWSKEGVRKDPEGTMRISRDDLRNMCSNYHYTNANEKIITEAKDSLLRIAIRKNLNIILDETNLNPRNFPDVCNLVREMKANYMVMEKPFYIDLEEAIARDALRVGSAHVGEEVVRQFWKKSGGKQHKFYKPKTEIIDSSLVENAAPEPDPSKPWCIICDLDGTLSLFNSIGKDGKVIMRYPKAHSRSPYDASKCENDLPNEQVIFVLESFYKDGYEIIFCSGREELYRTETNNFIKNNVNIQNYKLFMRETGDQRRDSIVKNEIYDANIKPRYNVNLVLDDRDQVVSLWRSLGLPCWQVAEGNF